MEKVIIMTEVEYPMWRQDGKNFTHTHGDEIYGHSPEFDGHLMLCSEMKFVPLETVKTISYRSRHPCAERSRDAHLTDVRGSPKWIDTPRYIVSDSNSPVYTLAMNVAGQYCIIRKVGRRQNAVKTILQGISIEFMMYFEDISLQKYIWDRMDKIVEPQLNENYLPSLRMRSGIDLHIESICAHLEYIYSISEVK